MSPLVSVLCPAYQAERFVEASMLSVLDQDYNSLELIVLDDASKDATVRVARDIANRYPVDRCRVTRHPENIGITANCNAALAQCQGTYIALFAADDLMYPGKISAQVALMERLPDVALTYHGVDVIDEHSRSSANIVDRGQKYCNVEDIIRYGGLPYTSSVMVRASCIPDHGYDNAIPSVSDWLFLIETALGKKIAKMPGIWSAYRRHGDGASRKTFEMLEETLRTLEICTQRYPLSGLNKACIQGRKRYLVGEIARAIHAGDRARLHALRHGNFDLSMELRVLALCGELGCMLGLDRWPIVRRGYQALQRWVKS